MQVKANKSFRYAGKTYRTGETIDMKDHDGKLMLAIRHVEAVKTAPPPEPAKPVRGRRPTRVAQTPPEWLSDEPVETESD